MNAEAKRERLFLLESEAARLRSELSMSGPTSCAGLSKREALLLEAERVAHLGSWTWNVRSGEIAWSDEFYRILGLAPHAVPPTAEAFMAAVHPDDRSRVQAVSHHHLEHGGAETLEFRVVRPGGETRHVRMAAAFVDDAEHPRTHVVGTVLDETDKLRTEALLKRTVEELSEAHYVAALGSWRVDLATGRIEWSDGMYRLLGLSGDESPSDDLFYRHVHPDDVARVQAHANSAAKSGVSEPLDLRIVREDGSVRDTLMRARAILDSHGRVAGFRGVLQDITERKALEVQLRQSQKMQAVGTLAGGVAHDFNNYLTVLGGHIELLSATLPEGSSARRSLDAMEEAYKRCVVLTQQLLTLSRKRAPQLRGVDLAELVTALVPMLRSMLGATVNLKLGLDRNAPAVVADPGQVEQALVNLALNARDAMPHGGTLTLDLHAIAGEPASASSPCPADCVRLSVRDTGCGIPEELQSRIFEPFFTTKPIGKGTGLGLSTVYGIVQDAGGTVRVESELGRGTTFHLYFRPAAAVEVSTQESSRRHLSPGRGRSVLLVEDVDLVRDLIKSQLESAGYHVLTASDGRAALRALSEHRVDAVVSDVVMPCMGGVELAGRLRALRPPIRCLLITGYSADVLNRDEAEVRVPLLRKPFSAAELTAALEQLFGGDEST